MTVPGSQRKRDQQLMAGVLERVRRWDPVGLDEIAPADEYEGLVGPLCSALRRGASAQELADAAEKHISNHFGITPDGSRKFAEDLLAWHSATPPSSDIQER